MCACAKFAFGPRAFGEIWCLTLFGQDGGFVGFFYHPNREAVDQKARELRQDFSQSKYAQVIDRYVLDEVRR
jgi:hypothetical protein